MAINPRQKQILATMGIPVWTAHRDIPGQKAPIVKSSGISGGSLDALEEQVAECVACDLHQFRKNTVFGIGDPQARLMIVGEAPGITEDLKAEPFAGPSGQLLNQILFALGLSRDDVYIANIVKCPPPEDRKPNRSEIESCFSYLQAQINLVNPKLILCLGAASAKALLNRNETIGKLRGQIFEYETASIPLIATYHPAYLLRKPTEKRAVWNDLLLVKEKLREYV